MFRQSIRLTDFDPKTHEPLSLKSLPGTEQAGGSKGSEAPAFVFLSVFKWEGRKGWDILLKAFLEEFKVRLDDAQQRRPALQENLLLTQLLYDDV